MTDETSAPALWPECGGNGGITRAGTPCRGRMNLCRECGRCLSHCQHRAEEAKRLRDAATSASLEARKPRRPDAIPKEPKTVEDAIKWAAWAAREVAAGRMDVRVSHEIGFLLRAFIDGKRHVDRTDDKLRTLRDKVKALTSKAQTGAQGGDA